MKPINYADWVSFFRSAYIWKFNLVPPLACIEEDVDIYINTGKMPKYVKEYAQMIRDLT